MFVWVSEETFIVVSYGTVCLAGVTDTEMCLRIEILNKIELKLVFKRINTWDADKSLARPTSRCRRKESIMSL